MPGMNRTGPEGLGPMTGRMLGLCGTGGATRGRGMGRAMRNGFGAVGGGGRGGARGFGRSVGPGRGLGWFSAGYSGAGYSGAGYEGLPSAQEGIKEALEARANMLRAELVRIEALLKDSVSVASKVDVEDAAPESDK